MTAGVSSTGCLQSSHSLRISRWATMQSTAEAIMNGGTPMSARRPSALGASLVCSVESTMWPVIAACTAIVAVSSSRISPTMMMSGSARSIVRSPAANVMPDLRVDGHLLDAGDARLDRVLDRDDRALAGVDLVERGVQRRRLARPGRTGDEHRAAVALQRLAEEVLLLGEHPEPGEVLDDRALVEDAHDHALALGERQRDEAQVDAPAVDVDRHAAVLGQAPLGDVQAGHHLHARDDATRHLARSSSRRDG